MGDGSYNGLRAVAADALRFEITGVAPATSRYDSSMGVGQAGNPFRRAMERDLVPIGLTPNGPTGGRGGAARAYAYDQLCASESTR